jgi:hypothetical protein
MPAYHTRQGSFIFGRSVPLGWWWPGTGRDRLPVGANLSLLRAPAVQVKAWKPPHTETPCCCSYCVGCSYCGCSRVLGHGSVGCRTGHAGKGGGSDRRPCGGRAPAIPTAQHDQTARYHSRQQQQTRDAQNDQPLPVARETCPGLRTSRSWSRMGVRRPRRVGRVVVKRKKETSQPSGCTQAGLPGPDRHCTMGANPKGRREGLVLTNSSRLQFRPVISGSERACQVSHNKYKVVQLFGGNSRLLGGTPWYSFRGNSPILIIKEWMRLRCKRP